MSKPGDWMKSVTWLANVGHVLGGYAVVLTCGFWTPHDPRVAVLGTGFAFGVALVKEYAIDLTLESGETFGSSTIDLLGYVAGAAIAWAELAARGWDGR